MHARKRARLCARAYAYVRVRASANPSRPDDISPGKRLFSPGRPGFLGLFAPAGRPSAALFAPVAAFSAKKSPGKPRPGVLFAPVSPAFRPIVARLPRHIALDRAPVCVFRPGEIGFSPRQAARRPNFSPATPHTARLSAPVTPALPAPAHPPGQRRPGKPGLRPRPATLHRFALRKGCVTPGGPRIPGRFAWRPPPPLA